MIAVNLDQVTVTYVTQPVFAGLSWDIHDDRCVGLVGPNGSGKSTLLKLIAGELASETGFVVRRKELSIGYLPQEPQFRPERNVWQTALAASSELAHIEAELERIATRLGQPEVYGDEASLHRALIQQEKLLEAFQTLGGPGYESRVRAILMSLGFDEIELTLPVTALSGGQKKLLGLAQLLVTQPDLLLLDEPDNHLDVRGKEFLESFITSYRGGVIIISHDRYLLDVVAEEIAELESGRLTRYPGNYSEYAFERQTRLLRQHELYQIQQREIGRLEQAAQRLLTWGRTHDNEKLIKRGKNILRRLDRIDRIERPVLESRKMRLALSGWRGSRKVLEIIDLDKRFLAVTPDGDEFLLFAGLDLLLWHGQRAGLIGPNGAGKSVLFRMILGQEPTSSGAIKIGPSVAIGYYAQEHDLLDPDHTLIETVRRAEPMSESGAINLLGRFLFNYEQARGRVAELSGGERSRLQIALLMLSDANFLLLDEPTNHLDIASAEVLEQALADFEGTVLVISHDRYFLDRVVDEILAVEEGALHTYPGGYSDYLEASANK